MAPAIPERRVQDVQARDQGAFSASDATGTGEPRIGAPKGASEYLGGAIDDVRAYARVLSPAEIARLFTSP